MKKLPKLGILFIVVGIVLLLILPTMAGLNASLFRGGYFDRVTNVFLIPIPVFLTGITLLIASVIRWKKKSDKVSDELQELKDKVKVLEKDKEKKD